jgi:hypothetical protein
MPDLSGLYWRRWPARREIKLARRERLLVQGLGAISPQIFNQSRPCTVPRASARSGDMRGGRSGRPIALSIVLKIHDAPTPCFVAIEEMMEQLVGINEATSHGAIRLPAGSRARCRSRDPGSCP